MLLILLAIVTIAFLVHRYLSGSYEYWKRKGVPSPPVNLFFGNLRDAITLKKALGQIFADIYTTYSNLPYVGIYKIRTPAILIRDPNIIKDILIKDFTSFHDNDIDIDKKADPLAAKNPFVLKGHEWKVTRALLGTCFTSGRMKTLLPLMLKVSEGLVAYLERECNSEDGLETKEVAAKFTTDNVASCAFGLEAKSFVDSKAEFREVGRRILEPSVLTGLKHLCILLFPSLSRLISIKFVPDDAAQYFRNVVTGTLKYRKQNNVVRNDILDMLDQFKNNPGEYGFTDDDVTAHAMGFFVDGVETSSITLSFTLYEVAANSDVQERLREEITGVLKRHGGDITYEAIQEMSYLDCVLSETLRIHPAGMFSGRRCTNSYSLPAIDKGSEPVTLDPGASVIIPTYALQHDEKYFPDPHRFDPDRFTEANRQNIVRGTYLPFGEGPRNCLGQRFAILQVKVGVVAVISNFEVRVNKKTIVPLKIDPRYFLLIAKGGLWLDYLKLDK